jgi:Ras-related protein Rab-1A
MEDMMGTIGFDMKIKQLEIDNKIVKLQLWDAAGDPKFKNI